MHFNIILLSKAKLLMWSLFFRSPRQIPIRPSFPHTCHMFRLSHFYWWDGMINIWWGVQVIELSVMYSSPLSCRLVPLRFKNFPQYPIIKDLQPMCLPYCERPRFTPIQNNRHIYNSVHLRLTFWTWICKTKDTPSNGRKCSLSYN